MNIPGGYGITLIAERGSLWGAVAQWLEHLQLKQEAACTQRLLTSGPDSDQSIEPIEDSEDIL